MFGMEGGILFCYEMGFTRLLLKLDDEWNRAVEGVLPFEKL